MAEKRINPLLIGGVVLAIGCLLLVMCSERESSYQPVEAVPGFDPSIKPEDGDTQTDTIKALQAYAREAVRKADELNSSTQENIDKVLENEYKVARLELANQEAMVALDQTKVIVDSLEQRVFELNSELAEITQRGNRSQGADSGEPVGDITGSDIDGNIGQLNSQGLPLGFGFGDGYLVPINPSQGAWYDSIDYIDPVSEEGNSRRFAGLLSSRSREANAATNSATEASKPEITIAPVYTIPKDATLVDSLALTALIGRIPVDGQTPDPYPVKIYVGRDNLLANGHDIPDVEGMIFSGLGFGDWNLSCVSARLTSATFIFSDGSIVNHTAQGQPLGYISDPSGVPCVSGRFVTNAPTFLSQRVALAGIGAAGLAYAEAQQQNQISSLTGTSTSSIIGDINKLAAGEAVQSATDEVSEWLLARQKQSFDAVVVNPGAAVSIHLDRSLALDKSSISRRVRYETSSSSVHYGLD